MKKNNKNIMKWKMLRVHGDVEKIAELIGKSRETARKVLNGGGSAEDSDIVEAFYVERAREVKSGLQQQLKTLS